MRPSRALAAALLSAGLLAGSPAVRADAEITLKDGTVLRGADLELKGDVYVLKTGPGEVALSVPWQLVARIKLTGGAAPPPTGLRAAKPQQLAGPPDPPRVPGYREQLAAFGRPPARFQSSPSPTAVRWRPESALGGDVTEFNPARWYEPPIDPTWTPQSAFTAAGDVTNFNPARWYRSPMESTWQPKDGFAGTRWFPPVVEEPAD